MPIITKVCPVCSESFRCWQRAVREEKTCSLSCGATLREQAQPRFDRKQQVEERLCERCGQRFTANRYKPTRYCSRRCATKARWESESLGAQMRAAVKPRSPKQRAAASARMRRLNEDPVVREKVAAARRGRTFVGQRGGNGQLTPQQRKLAEALGWTTEYSIPTGNSSWRSATVDIAYPPLRIAVECDGASHRSRMQKNRDIRKEAMLSALGWAVLRFWNAEIDERLEMVLERIRVAVAARSSASSP